MEKPHIFYTIYRIENDVDVDVVRMLHVQWTWGVPGVL